MQTTDLGAHDELVPETAPEPIETPRTTTPPSPPFGQYCCYPIGEPRTPEFRYCCASVAQHGVPYCLEHMRLCHVGRDIAA